MTTRDPSYFGYFVADQLMKCLNAARAEGWTGDARDYDYTEADMDAVIGELERLPTLDEWTAAFAAVQDWPGSEARAAALPAQYVADRTS